MLEIKRGFIVSSWMANPSGNHQEHTHVVSSSAPETSGAALAMKHNPGISLDWTAEEQAILEDGLSKSVSYFFLCTTVDVVFHFFFSMLLQVCET